MSAEGITEELLRRLSGEESPYDLVVLPEEDHMSAGFSSDYALQAMKRYLVEHLKPRE